MNVIHPMRTNPKRAFGKSMHESKISGEIDNDNYSPSSPQRGRNAQPHDFNASMPNLKSSPILGKKKRSMQKSSHRFSQPRVETAEGYNGRNSTLNSISSKKRNGGKASKSFSITTKGAWGYETFMNTGNYHIVSGKVGLEKLQYSVERNDKSHLDYDK